MHREVALGVAAFAQQRIRGLDGIGRHEPTLTEEIALRWDRDVRREALAANVEAADDRHRDTGELAGDEVRRRRDLVRDGDDGVLKLVADRIVLAREVLHHLHPGGADGNVDGALPPRTAERVGDDHAYVTGRSHAELVAYARRGPVGIEWKQDERSRLWRIGCIDARRRADEPMLRLADDERRADPDHAPLTPHEGPRPPPRVGLGTRELRPLRRRR